MPTSDSGTTDMRVLTAAQNPIASPAKRSGFCSVLMCSGEIKDAICLEQCKGAMGHAINAGMRMHWLNVQGTFTNKGGSGECSTCTVGKWTEGKGSSACAECVVGKYGTSAGCIACDKVHIY